MLHSSCPFTEGILMNRRQEEEKKRRAEQRKKEEEAERKREQLEQEMEDALRRAGVDGDDDSLDTIMRLVRQDRNLAYYKADNGVTPMMAALRRGRPDVMKALLGYYQHILIPHDVVLEAMSRWGDLVGVEKENAELKAHLRGAEDLRYQDRSKVMAVLEDERKKRKESEETVDKLRRKLQTTRETLRKACDELDDYEEIEGLLPKDMSPAKMRKLLLRSLRQNGVYRKKIKALEQLDPLRGAEKKQKR